MKSSEICCRIAGRLEQHTVEGCVETLKRDGGLALIEPEEEGNVQAISRNPLALASPPPLL